MKSEMTVTMSLPDYQKYEKYYEKYSDIVNQLNNCFLIIENRAVLKRDELISLMKKVNPKLNDCFFDM